MPFAELGKSITIIGIVLVMKVVLVLLLPILHALKTKCNKEEDKIRAITADVLRCESLEKQQKVLKEVSERQNIRSAG